MGIIQWFLVSGSTDRYLTFESKKPLEQQTLLLFKLERETFTMKAGRIFSKKVKIQYI